MPTKHVYLQGKAKWVNIFRPDKFGSWSLQLYMTPESIEKFKTMGLRTELKKDEDGYYAKFKCDVQKEIRGKKIAFPRPMVVDLEGKPTEVHIGNGSDITIKLDHYNYRSPKGETGWAARLSGVRIDNLVEYERERDASEEDNAQLANIQSQPPQIAKF